MTKRKPFSYDPETLRYRYIESGRLVPESVIRSDVRRLSYGTRTEMRDLAVQYKNGEITLDEWYAEMRSAMKADYRTAIDLARGGQGVPFSPQEKGQFGRMMRQQYEYLNKFAKELRDGKVKLDGRFVTRCGMYGEAVNTMYENWRKLMASKAGYDQERRRLQPAEHCEDCLREAAKGWQPIGTLLPIGQAQCRTNCHCFYQYRRKPKPRRGNAATQ